MARGILPAHADWQTVVSGLLLNRRSDLLVGLIVHRRRELSGSSPSRTADLQQSKSRFDQFTEQSRTVAWEVDARGLYTYASHVQRNKFTANRPDELVGRLLLSMICIPPRARGIQNGGHGGLRLQGFDL